jgi:hypothetical protein
MLAGLAVATGVAGAGTPANGGAVGGTLIAINTSTGDQTDSHVSGDLASYTDNAGATSHVRYYDFASGVDLAIPNAGELDLLSDVNAGRVAFSRARADGTTAAMLFDVSTGALRDLDPQPGSNRFGVVLGGDTVAYQELNSGNGDIYAYDLTSGTVANLSQSPDLDQNPAVAPSGNVVVWERCVGSNCDILQSVRSGGAWEAPTPISATTSNESNPDTDGTTVVYDSNRPSPTGQDIYMQPVSGGVEVPLELAGLQRNPSISRGVIAFESKETTLANADLFLYVIATNILYRVTDTPTVEESLSDVSVLPNGAVRVLWAAADDDIGGNHNIYARNFTVPLASSTFSGFFAPVDNPPVVNVAKGGQAIPVEFSLGGNQGLDIFAAGYPTSQQIACDSSAPLDDVEQTVPAGSSSLSYDATTDQYTYVWKTDKTWAKTCRQLTVRLSDGSDHIAYFRFG